MNALALAAVLVVAVPSQAPVLVEPSTGVKFLQNATVEGQPFLCLGTGVRKKAFFKVYAVVYCVEEAAGREAIRSYFTEGPGKVHEARGEELAKKLQDDPGFFNALMRMPVERFAQMVFVRDVGKEKMKDAFEESLTRALGPKEKQRIESFIGLLDRDLKDGDKLMLRTRPDGTIRLGLEGDLKTVKDGLLAGAVWEPYLGKDSVTPELKRSVAKAIAAMKP